MKKIDPSHLSPQRALQDSTKPQLKALRAHPLSPSPKSEGIVSDIRPKLSDKEAAALATGLRQSLHDDERSIEAQGKGLTESRVLDLLSEDG